MAEYRVLPDVEAVAAATIRNAAISGLGTRVYSSVPGNPTFPLAVVRRVGGEPAVRPYMDGARIEVLVWGTSKSEAHDIAQRARIALLESEGTSMTSPVAAWISGVDDSQGMTWDPDQSTGRDRYLFAMRIYARSTD